jgi:predicted secreted protein
LSGILGVEDRSMKIRLLSAAWVVLALALAQGQPAWAKKRIGPEAVWEPSPSEVAAFKEKCASSDPAKTRACLIGAMKAAGASKEAQEFTSQLPEPGYMRNFADAAPAGVAYVSFPYRANENNVVYLVNGKPDFVNVDDQSLLPRGDVEKDPVYTALKAKSSEATLWPGDRYSQGRPSSEPAPGGGVRFLVDYRILNGCHACEELGTAIFSFEFDETGKFKGASLVKVEDSRNVQRKLDVTSGQEFNIRLKADQGSGYRWIVTKTPDEGVLKFAWKLYNAPDPQVPGSSGEEIWGFKAMGKGTTRIQLSYVNPTKGNAEPGRQALYEVTVK